MEQGKDPPEDDTNQGSETAVTPGHADVPYEPALIINTPSEGSAGVDTSAPTGYSSITAKIPANISQHCTETELSPRIGAAQEYAISDSIRLQYKILRDYFGQNISTWISNYSDLSTLLSLEDTPEIPDEWPIVKPTNTDPAPQQGVYAMDTPSSGIPGDRVPPQREEGSDWLVLPGEIASTSTGGYTSPKTALAHSHEARETVSSEVLTMLRNLDLSVTSTDSDPGEMPPVDLISLYERDGSGYRLKDRPLTLLPTGTVEKAAEERPLAHSPKPKKGKTAPSALEKRSSVTPKTVFKKTNLGKQSSMKRSCVPIPKTGKSPCKPKKRLPSSVLTSDDLANCQTRFVICCPVEGCSDIFTNNDMYMFHLSTHGNIEVCTECWAVLPNMAALNIHAIIHNSSNTPYRCIFDYCSARFSNMDELRNHVSIHTCSEPYQCPKCRRAFRCRGDVIDHLRSHTGIVVDI